MCKAHSMGWYWSLQVGWFFLYKCKKNLFITLCKAHSKVTHIKQQKIFALSIKGRGYNKDYVLYPFPTRWWKYFCFFICVTLLWALHNVINKFFLHFYKKKSPNLEWPISSQDASDGQEAQKVPIRHPTNKQASSFFNKNLTNADNDSSMNMSTKMEMSQVNKPANNVQTMQVYMTPLVQFGLVGK